MHTNGFEDSVKSNGDNAVFNIEQQICFKEKDDLVNSVAEAMDTQINISLPDQFKTNINRGNHINYEKSTLVENFDDLEQNDADATNTQINISLPDECKTNIYTEHHTNHKKTASIEIVDDMEQKKSCFIEICLIIDKNPDIISLPGTWIPQVISKGVKCMMWTEYSAGHSRILKRIILFSDMSLKVSVLKRNIYIFRIFIFLFSHNEIPNNFS